MYILDSEEYEAQLNRESECVLVVENKGTWLTADELRELADLLDRQNEGDRLDEGGHDYTGEYADFYIEATANGDIIYK